jgi:hypothetical protein
MDVTLPYPDRMPQPEIMLLVATLTGKKAPDRSAMCHAGWVVQGFMQRLLLGVPESEFEGKTYALSTGQNVVLRECDVVEALANVCDEQTAYRQLKRMGGEAMATRWIDIADAGLAKLVLPLLVRWVGQWAAGGGIDNLIDKIVGQKSESLMKLSSAIVTENEPAKSQDAAPQPLTVETLQGEAKSDKDESGE